MDIHELDLMFQLCSKFKNNREFEKISIALDAAFLLGAIRHNQISNESFESLIMMQQMKFDKLGIKTQITKYKLL